MLARLSVLCLGYFGDTMIAKTLDSETVNAAYGALLLKNIYDKVNADAHVPDLPADAPVRISFLYSSWSETRRAPQRAYLPPCWLTTSSSVSSYC